MDVKPVRTLNYQLMLKLQAMGKNHITQQFQNGLLVTIIVNKTFSLPTKKLLKLLHLVARRLLSTKAMVIIPELSRKKTSSGTKLRLTYMRLFFSTSNLI